MSKAYPPTKKDGNYRSRPFITKNRILMERAVYEFMTKARIKVVEYLSKGPAFNKAIGTPDEYGIDWSELADAVQPYLASVAVASGKISVSSFTIKSEDSFEEGMRIRAHNYSMQRSAEMVGMRRQGEFLVQNPNAKWRIDENTRAQIKDLVATAVEEGMSTAELSDLFEDSFTFSKSRCNMIARTEVAKADSEGAIMGWKQTGLVRGKSWLSAQDELVSEECQENEAKGVVPLDYDYGEGVLAPPQHPNCRCTLLPELLETLGEHSA